MDMVYVSVRQKLAALKIDFGEFGYSDILSYKNGMILIFRNREISDLGPDGALPGDNGTGSGREMYKFVYCKFSVLTKLDCDLLAVEP
jgi:hypothetical protein